MLLSALAYTKTLKWSVIPLEPNGKRANLTGRGYLDGTTDESTIRSWWSRWPDANIGVVTGKTMAAFVVDVDTRNDGPNQLAQLERIYTELPSTVRATTASGGWHLLFKLPMGPLKSKLCGGVDIKRDGGYVVAPPSVIDGKPYVWQNSPWDCKIAMAPQWLAANLKEEREVSQLPSMGSDALFHRAKLYVAKVPPAVSGQGGSTATLMLAGTLINKFQLTSTLAYQLMSDWNRTCVPMWTDAELKRKINQAAIKLRNRC